MGSTAEDRRRQRQREARQEAAFRRKLYRYLMMACPADVAAAEAGEDPARFRRRLKRRPMCRSAVRQARLRGAFRLHERIWKVNDWRAWAWLLERLFGPFYGPPRAGRGGEEGDKDRSGARGDQHIRRRLLEFLQQPEQGPTGDLPPEVGADGGRP